MTRSTQDEIEALKAEAERLQIRVEAAEAENDRYRAGIAKMVANLSPVYWVLLAVPRLLRWYRPVCWLDEHVYADDRCSMCGAHR